MAGVIFMGERVPLLLRGEETGFLTVERRGLITEFSARCPDPGGLVRLSVYGGGKEGYLGVMEPANGALTLCRKLTREDMRAFPSKIEYAAEAGGVPGPPPKRENAPGPRRQERSADRGNDVVWTQVGDGSLYAVWRGRPCRAVPMAAWGLPLERALDRRVIDGVEYAVFPLEKGRLPGPDYPQK